MGLISVFLATMLLPFLLIFVLVFAILQKTKLLGDGKQQIDAMVALAVALILIGFPQPRDIVVSLVPWVAVGAIVILIFFILYGFVAGDLSGDKIPKWMKGVFGVLAAIFTAGVVLYVTGLGKVALNFFSVTGDSGFWVNAIVAILVVGAVVWVILGSKPKEEKKKEK
ncbi:MAG: hypothetical protein Q8N88_01765 [Nanoarchaeota archaeon]|nr:hypothetical protein [Nanoarchaeota archaeon]